MALLVWFTMGIALWHFTVFLPDRFWQGIVGAFLGSVIGAVVFGAIVEVDHGRGLGTTDVMTALTAIPGSRSALRSSGRSACAPNSKSDSGLSWASPWHWARRRSDPLLARRVPRRVEGL